MPPVVRAHRDVSLASSCDTVMLLCRRLPPLCAVPPFPVALAVRFCSDVRESLGQFHHDFVLLVAVDAGNFSSLCFAEIGGVLVVPLAGVVLEALVVDISPALRTECGRCG